MKPEAIRNDRKMAAIEQAVSALPRAMSRLAIVAHDYYRTLKVEYDIDIGAYVIDGTPLESFIRQQVYSNYQNLLAPVDGWLAKPTPNDAPIPRHAAIRPLLPGKRKFRFDD